MHISQEEIRRLIAYKRASARVPPRRAAATAYFLKLTPDKMPQHVLNQRLDEYPLSEQTSALLKGSDIKTVGDFIKRTKSELFNNHGLSGTAVEEVTKVLLSWGIRTVDNPPMEPKVENKEL